MPYYEIITYLDGPKAGASEKFAIQASTESIDTVRTDLTAVLQKRNLMLTKSWDTVAVRVTKTHDGAGVPIQRQSQLYPVSFEKNPSATNTSDGWFDAQSDTAIRVNFFGNNRLNKRAMLLAGYPRGCVINGGTFIDVAPSWRAQFDNWRTSLKAFNIGWFTSGYLAAQNVVTYATTTTGQITVTTAGNVDATLTPVTRFRVRLAGINDESELNGAWTATNNRAAEAPAGAFSFDLVGRFGVIPFTGGGTARRQTFTWQPVGINTPYGGGGGEDASVAIYSVAKRQRGAPFGTGRGRARKRTRT